MLNRITDTLSSVPREARDTLFLLAVIAWVVLLQSAHIPWWCSGITAGVLVWRAVLTVRGAPLPGWVWRAALLAVTLGATFFTFRTLVGRDAGVTLIVVLLALKTLELRARRDAFVVFFLGFFTLLTHFFYSQSLVTAAGILVALLGLLTALVNAHMPVGRPSLARSARIAGSMALMGAPIMLVLFLLFPRLAPLWGTPGDPETGRSGLSGQMRVGQIARLALDESIALRVRFNGPTPPQDRIYFRGPVLSTFDGREWRPLESDFGLGNRLSADLQVAGTPLDYEVTMEPHDRPWLFVLEGTATPPEVPGTRVRMNDELQWLTQRPMGSLVRFTAQAYPEFRHGPQRLVLGLQDFLTLPPSYNPRTLQLAQELRRQYGPGPENAPRLVQAALDLLRTGGYSYTLDPGVYGRDTADEFWFDRKAGFCEHIASSFAILMRGMDIPARIVTGYQGGEVNGVDGYWTVRQRDAHAWTEVWLQGQGWVRVDPTGAVMPGRIGSFDRLAAPQTGVAGALTGVLRNTFSDALINRARQSWEALNNRWNQWVLNYTQGRQLDLLRSLGFESPSWTDLAKVMAGLLALASLVGAAWTLWERQQHDPWLRLLERARRRLLAAGLQVPPQAPPRTLATAVRARWGEAGEPVAQWLLRLEAQRYSAGSAPPLRDLAAAFRQLAWPADTPT